MRTSLATRPRNGSSVSRRTDASTPSLCNSSTTRERHCRPKPFFARYNPPPRRAATARIASKRSALAKTRRPKGDCRSCARAGVWDCSRTGGMELVKALKRLSDLMIQRFNSLLLPPTYDFYPRSSSRERVAQFGERCFYLDGLVSDPARRVAAAHGLHDHSGGFIDIFSGWLHRLPCACGRKIDPPHGRRASRVDLLSDAHLTRSARLRHPPAGDRDACPGC